MENNLSGLLGRVKTATKQAANATVRQAKIARLRFDLMAVHSERAKHLQNIGGELFSMYKHKKQFDQSQLFADLKSDISSIKSLDKRIEAIEAQLEAQQLGSVEVEIKDVTPN